MASQLSVPGVPTWFIRALSRESSPHTLIAQGGSRTASLTLVVSAVFVGLAQVVPGLNQYRVLFDLWSIFLVSNSVSPQWIYTALGHLWIPTVGEFLGTVRHLLLAVWFANSPHDVARAVLITRGCVGLPIWGRICLALRQIPRRGKKSYW
jgi:hypothetical protein